MHGKLRDFLTFSLIFGGTDMSESIKETAERIFGMNQPLTWEQLQAREISLEEMERYRKESQEKLKEKRGKGSQWNKTKNVGEVSRNPCSKCGIEHWDIFPDGRIYCLKCGHVEEPETCEFKCGNCGVVFQTQGKDIQAAMKLQVPHQEHDPTANCDGIFQFEKIVKPIKNSKEITGDKIMSKILVDFRCDKCWDVVSLQAPSVDEAMTKTVPHMKLNPEAGCDGTLYYMKETKQKPEPSPIPEHNKAETRINEREVAPGILERFKHPKLGKSFCENCYDKKECPESYYHMHICLLISMDKKLKKLVDRWLQ
jgi:hypothetical protein